MSLSINESIVSIIILTKNAGSEIENLMISLKNQVFNGKIEVIAIDSGSTDMTLNILKKYGAKIFKIASKEFNHGKTRNMGAEKSKGDVLVFLTQDVLPIEDNWLINLLKNLENNNVGIVYGRQVPYPYTKKTEMFFYHYFYSNKPKILDKKDIKDKKRFYLENVFISDVCSAIKKDIWREIKFSEDVTLAEDKEFALRLLDAGYKGFYEPNAVVYHSHNYSLSSLFKRRFNDGVAFSSITFHGKNKFLLEGLNYFIEEMKFFINNRYIMWIPYAVLYDFIYFLGFQLGYKNDYIPHYIKERFKLN